MSRSDKEYKHAWYMANRDRLLKKRREYHVRNRESILAKGKAYSRTAGGCYNSYKANANRDNRVFALTRADFNAICSKPCFYCGVAIDGVRLDRIDNGVGYIATNVRQCCTRCNTWKHTLSEQAFYDHALAIVRTSARNTGKMFDMDAFRASLEGQNGPITTV